MAAVDPEKTLPIGSAPKADLDDLVGQTLADGRYRLLEVIGSGGMGKVYLAEHAALGRQVAIKVLSGKQTTDEQVRRFVREAQTVSRLEHDNIVDVHDFGPTENGSAFIAMENLRGETLADTLDREGKLPWLRAKKIILQVCRALHFAHTRGVLHRDIKPDNCFRLKRRSNTDYIKVLDFGLAKVMTEDESPSEALTRTGTLFGTPEYMSPEQARGQTVDARSDVYSLGVLLYELLTGRVPFRADTFVGVLTAAAVDAPPRPRDVAPDAQISVELERVVLRSLEKDPEKRYQSMRELGEAIAAVSVGGKRATGPAALLPAVGDDEGLRRWLVVSLAINGSLVLLSLALAIVAATT